MTFTCRSLAGLGLMFATVAGLVPAEGGRLRDLARELWRLPEVRRRAEGERQRREALEERGEIILGRVRAKEAVIDQLIAGRVGLYEAAASFRAINRRMPPTMEFGYDVHGCRSDAERYCRQVLSLARNRALRMPPGTVAGLVGRLEADLEDRLRRDGDVRLPQVN